MAVGTISCNKDKSSRAFMPPITGRAGEVTLVMEDELYEGFVGDSLYAIICQEEPSLPSSGMDGAEAMFDLIQMPPSGFGNLFKSNRNIIIVTIDKELEEAVIQVDREYWARHQLIIRLAAPDKKQLVELFSNKDDFIVNTLRDTEIDRQVFLNNKFENTELVNQLERNHKFRIQFPKGWHARVDKEHFTWVQYDPPDITQGVLIHYYPYTDESQIEYENLMIDTDKWLKENVPGSADGSYMSFELDRPITSKTFTKDNHYVRELRGLWEMQKGFMGGPFVCWSFVDEQNSRIVSVFGFVFAPRFDKRNHIRKVESLLRTFTITEAE